MSVTIDGTSGITNGNWAYYTGAWANYASSSGAQITPVCFTVRSTSTSTTGTVYMLAGNWTADADE